MIGVTEFGAGLGVIALQVRHSLQPAEIDAFHAALGDEIEPREWLAFARVAARRFGWRFLPTVAELLDALREFRGAPALELEAALAYERVIAAANYTPEGGASWNFRDVRQRCGAAAAQAFLEAGGHHAFATGWDEARRRERFLAAYRDEARERPAGRLLPAGAARALPAGEAPQLTEGEARGVIERLRQMTGSPAPRPKPGDGIVRASEDRLRLLRRQAEEITR